MTRRNDAKDPHKRRARNKTWKAILNGTLVQNPCEVCGELPAEAHHDDYSKPLEVRWLCKMHHAEHHKQAAIRSRKEA
ncbi:hypothetical protein VW35_00890 [Devosia soli]|uniref:HNH endonuclease n=1 Tax=Devosia soli TaxID=361041 RepID=A0A0F5LGU7_9HYPH|nr:hypothetical protein VW35_00890 [Devosia soli]